MITITTQNTHRKKAPENERHSLDKIITKQAVARTFLFLPTFQVILV